MRWWAKLGMPDGCTACALQLPAGSLKLPAVFEGCGVCSITSMSVSRDARVQFRALLPGSMYCQCKKMLPPTSVSVVFGGFQCTKGISGPVRYHSSTRRKLVQQG